ncbi:C6 zinc finger domain protein [Fusarium beomiforme]|uniref:C6 zinc finger domain protein n=1 Tax=Fusarium beomiforme TaxID=44412 RepID=A0A9P5E0B5_9HYPO|nr:C6 zinc finger domain protein [Fusarium beomiforme]
MDELDTLLDNLYDQRDSETIPPQTKASLLVILALGALSTPETDLAESLFTEAKREAVILDDAVTLKTLQLSILFADYQVNMGRPNSTYLHLGVACRKAFALGLNIGALSSTLDGLTLQKHEATIWSLYFHETHQALTLGRRSGLKLADIECPIPTEPQPLVRLCRMATIMEDAAESIYGKKSNSLRQLYVTAERLYARLRQFAEEIGIASAHSSREQATLEPHEFITLHNLYYHSITLIFRPFLVASHVLQVSGGTSEIKDMWLRQACSGQVSAGSRYYAFFVECSTAVLLYDILCHPSKYSFNMEYIQKAMQVFSGMVQDEPVTSSFNSVHRVLEAIERSISNQVPGLPLPTPSDDTTSPNQHSRIQFPSLDQLGMNEHERMLLLTGEGSIKENRQGSLAPGLQNTLMDQDWTNPSHFNLNVMTTDLFNFFPLNMSTPPWPNS